ncbi:TetR/AcrR family transcriptional regulator [Mycobacterium sp. 21AC1]|uniref:TetR/AcrR family transcriptional regulator n=1 Tax=[Mycobacterium] appelbergii TaxID=2939269 RepID=UPI002938FF81|nr:helix-turn-helix domain-containing protein [Mycobacterium sp. 21AC1]MDV3126898.1 TetR/AcrR family transcriptional regulator [Mycobacterium sp. 21AC1]
MNRGSRAKAELLDAAERLIAEHGYDVPLRDIALAAGQRNNSAVNYHFRNRQELVDAVVARRLLPMELERERMLSDLDSEQSADARALLRILVLPLVDVDATHYARFLEVVRPRLPAEPQRAGESAWPRVLDALSHAVPISDRRLQHRRVSAVATAMFALIADRERQTQDVDRTPEDPEEIIGMLAAMLTAPISASACPSPQGG